MFIHTKKGSAGTSGGVASPPDRAFVQGIPPGPRRCSIKIVRRLIMKLEGIHHITAITGDAPGNVGFYAGTMGLRLVKKTVNQDDPTVYHLFYADEAGS